MEGEVEDEVKSSRRLYFDANHIQTSSLCPTLLIRPGFEVNKARVQQHPKVRHLYSSSICVLSNTCLYFKRIWIEPFNHSREIVHTFVACAYVLVDGERRFIRACERRIVLTLGLFLKEANDDYREVFKDAFTLPQSSRIIKAWERAPVQGHAPRLQGQKIWKRTGAKSQRQQDKENYGAAQLELKAEGMGARKKMRLRGVKENIGDATWEDNMKEKAARDGDMLATDAAASTNMEMVTFAPSPLNDADVNALHWIPRKRTNANHVITPRKHLRQTTLNSQVVTQAFVRSPHPTPEGPRRRKSMRKSIRTSIAPRISDIPEAVVQEAPTIGTFKPEVVQVEVANEATPPIPESELEAEKVAAEESLNDRLNILFNLTDVEDASAEEAEKCDADRSLNSHGSSPRAVPVQLNDMREDAAASPSRSPTRSHSNNGSKCTADSDGEEHLRGRQDMEPSAVLPSIETDHSPVQSSKTTSIQKRKSGASQRRNKRRSTRATRASSAQVEDQRAPIEPAIEAPGISVDSAAQHESAAMAPDDDDEAQITAFEPGETVENSRMPHSQEPADIITPKLTIFELERSVQDRCHRTPNNTTDLDGPKKLGSCSRSEDAELEDFDISAQLTLQLSADTQHQTSNEDFDLEPIPASVVTILPGSSLDEARLPPVHRGEGSLISLREDSMEESSPVRFSPIHASNPQRALELNEFCVEGAEKAKPISVSADIENENNSMSPTNEDLPGSSTPDPTTSKLVETISENTQHIVYDHDETDMLRSFLTRVQANKAAKAGNSMPKRKRSLPHSPLKLPLGETTNTSPWSKRRNEDFDLGPPGPSPSKKQKPIDPVLADDDDDDTITERKPTRRSGRTRLPVIKTPLGAPSHIPVRRLGQDADTTVTLKRTEEKELAALTRVNTRKNKGGSQSVAEVLVKKTEEREDPALRQRLLKEVFDENAKKARKEKRKTVVWAEELTQYQTVEGRKLDGAKEEGKETEKVAITEEKKKSAVKVGIRSKIALGMAANGTPAPKRKKAR